MQGDARVAVRVCAMALLAGGCSYGRGSLYGDNGAVDAGPVDRPHPTEPRSRPTDPYDQAIQLFDDADACIACMEAECSEEATACADDAECAAEVDCRSLCDDGACNMACWDPYPIDDAPTLALTACGRRCATECAVGRHWDCVGKYDWPEPPQDDDEVVQLRLNENLGVTPVEGIRARVCAPFDADCETPLTEVLDSDSEGMLTLRLPPGNQAGRSGKQPFDGYIELRDESAEPTHMTVLLYLPAPGWSNTHPYKVPLFTLEGYAAMAPLFGVDDDPNRGGIAATFYDCQFFPTEVYGVGVSVTASNADDRTATFYTADPAATETGFRGTAITSGMAGLTTVTARFDGDIISERAVQVRPGGLQSMTMVWSGPAAAD